VTGLLKARYRSPQLNNKDDPLDELFFILLSQMTTGPSYERVYDRLKAAVPEWSQLLRIDLGTLIALIGDAGLAKQKAPRMVAIAGYLARDFGDVTLEPLRRMTDEDAEAFLMALPGVGLKTAKCVLMYTGHDFGREVGFASLDGVDEELHDITYLTMTYRAEQLAGKVYRFGTAVFSKGVGVAPLVGV
jgi:endonuclease III